MKAAPGEAPPPEPYPKPAVAPASPALPSSVIGALAGAGVTVVVLLIVLFSRTSAAAGPIRAGAPVHGSGAPGPSPGDGPTAAATPARRPAAPVEELKNRFREEVLSTLRDTQLKKNIAQFMTSMPPHLKINRKRQKRPRSLGKATGTPGPGLHGGQGPGHRRQ